MKNKPPPRTAWLTAPPKSGGSRVNLIVQNYLQWKRVIVAPQRSRAEQEVLLPRNFDTLITDIWCTHSHTKATTPSLNFIREYEVRVIIPVRSLLDSIVSLREHITQRGINIPICYVHADFLKLSEHDQYTNLIYNALPWYVNFYTSWFESEEMGLVKPHYVHYARFTGDPATATRDILKHLDAPINKERLDRVILTATPEKTKFNIGKTGRGATLLTEDQQSLIKHLLNSQPSKIAARLADLENGQQ